MYYKQMMEVLKGIDIETTVEELQNVFKVEKLKMGQFFIRILKAE